MQKMKKLLLLFLVGAHGACVSAEIIAQLAPGASPSKVGAAYGLTLIDVTDGGPFALYLVPNGQDPEVVEAMFEADPQVVWAEENDDMEMPEHSGAGKATVIGAVGSPFSFYSLNAGFFQQVNWMPPASGAPIREVRVAILDTGLSPYQPYLWKHVVAAANFVEIGQSPYDIPRRHDTSGNNIADEGAGHGTMVAGVVAQMAPHAGLVPVRVADSDGVTTSWRIIEGLVFAVNSNAKVINVSLGAVDRITALSDMLDWVEAAGSIVVAAAGNNGTETDFFPASYSEAISVCAIDHLDRKASFSNWEGHVDMSAPGTGIKSYYWNGSMAVWSGTSFSSPMVAAGIAIGLEYATRPYSTQEIQSLLDASGTDIDPLNPQYEGRIGVKLNIRGFVLAIRSGTP